MILDNENQNLKVHEWIQKYHDAGEISIVTGYFTIGALVYLANVSKELSYKYRFILGDIVHFDSEKSNALDLLNESIDIDTSLKMKQLAQEAVRFLELEKVEVKTLEPNFCHAKLYLLAAQKDSRFHYFISGSSNLTEAGIGLKRNANVELNIAETGDNGQYRELLRWFNDLWVKPQAHKDKTLIDAKGKKQQIPFKQYLINEISRIFVPYEPEHIYYKILFELFHKEEQNAVLKQALGKLENTNIFEKLYPFQRTGVNSLIEMLEKYNGAILADAVGLGKTWSALAVIKYYQMQGREVILLCPKKLSQNWTQYLKRNYSLFEEDKFDYVVRFHTDLREGGMNKGKVHEDFFTNDRPKLFVIDESHNLRNDKSSRYQFLVDKILKESKGESKVLLLSATPINNSFKDVRNQFRLMVKGENAGFQESLDIKNLEHTFREVQTVFNEWSIEKNAKLSDFYLRIKDSNFFKLTDNLLVARTRKTIQANFENNLTFPKHKKPINIFKTPFQFGDMESFAELMENMDLKLSAYQPAFYTFTKEQREQMIREREERKRKGEKEIKDAILQDDMQRQFYLVKMMMILMLKRLESSWFAFHLTIQRIYEHHEKALNKIIDYEDSKKNSGLEGDLFFFRDVIAEGDDDNIFGDFLLGKKKPVPIQEIDAAGMLGEFKKDIKQDKKTLRDVLHNLNAFKEKIDKEKAHKTQDIKLAELIKIMEEKQKCSNKKVLIFSAYKDTVRYIFDELGKRGFSHFAMVSGDENFEGKGNISIKNHEDILQRFAPYTKLFKEKNWKDFSPSMLELSPTLVYEEWVEWVKNEHKVTYEKLQNPIHILITTDVLSEGQNMQDADLVINYDIHWNPVRVIQRVGRIDRIGSPNAEIQSINFWPAKDIDTYINLKARVEKRMAIMKLAGSEVIDHFTADFAEMSKDEQLEARQNANMIRQMQESMQEIDAEKSIGFDDFSFDNYRQILQDKLNQQKRELEQLPNAIFSGFRIDKKKENEMAEGLIALLGYPAQKKYNPLHKYADYQLIYIDFEGNVISNNQKIILEQLSRHYKAERYLDPDIESGKQEKIANLSNALRKWIKEMSQVEVELSDGTSKQVASQTALDLLNQFKKGSKKAIEQIKTEGSVSEKFDFDKFDLIAWLVVSEENN